MTPELRDIVLNRSGLFPASAVRDAAMRHGMRSIAAKAVEVLRNGLTTVEEASGAMSFSLPLVPELNRGNNDMQRSKLPGSRPVRRQSRSFEGESEALDSGMAIESRPKQ